MKVRGERTYLYRAVDKHGKTIDFYLSPSRNTAAVKRVLAKTSADSSRMAVEMIRR